MRKCKLCGSVKIGVLKKITSPINAFDYTLYQCQTCASAFFNLNEYPVDLKQMYDDFKDRAEFPLAHVSSNKWILEKQIAEKLIKKPIKSVLDVGCRTGDFLMHFDHQIKREGVELSACFCEIAKKRGLTVHNDFLERIKFTSSFDLVSCYAILEHLEHPLVFLESLTSIVNKGGLLVIMIPYYFSLKRKVLPLLGKSWHMFTPPEHLNFYSGKFLDSYFRKKGFERVKRNYLSGGMYVFEKNNFMRKCEYGFNQIVDKTILSKIPIFDHRYCYYIKKQ
ncbi:MAG: class I SAM-dependent methyltransferase [Salinivirgaceae bacterium]|jgi:SAM-dependent methyltransferase